MFLLAWKKENKEDADENKGGQDEVKCIVKHKSEI